MKIDEVLSEGWFIPSQSERALKKYLRGFMIKWDDHVSDAASQGQNMKDPAYRLDVLNKMIKFYTKPTAEDLAILTPKIKALGNGVMSDSKVKEIAKQAITLAMQKQANPQGNTQKQPVDTTVPRQETPPGQKPIAGTSGQATATMAPQQQPLKATSVSGTVNDPYSTDQPMSMGGRVSKKGEVLPGKQTQQKAKAASKKQARTATSNTAIPNGATVTYSGKPYKWVNDAWRASDTGEVLTGKDAEAATYTFRNPE